MGARGEKVTEKEALYVGLEQQAADAPLKASVLHLFTALRTLAFFPADTLLLLSFKHLKAI